MDNRIKIIGTVAIIAFSLLFTVLIAIFVLRPLIKKQKIQAEIEKQQAIEFKEIADSIQKQAEIKADSIIFKHSFDSLVYVSQKESLKTKFNQKIKKYESRLADIDTVNIELNSSFSVKQMLSDSSSKLW